MIHVMIVEDEWLIRQTIKFYLDWEHNGLALVGEASDGLQALNLMSEVRVDLLITDIHMPVMNGLELVAAVRERGLPCDVIILSSYDDYAYMRSALQMQVKDYIHKPTMTRGEFNQVVLAAVEDIRVRMLTVSAKTEEPDAADTREALPEHPQVAAIVSYIQSRYAEDVSLEQAGAVVHMSPAYLSRLFQKEMGCSFSHYVIDTRIARAKELLAQTDLGTYEIANRVGYRNHKYFYRQFKQREGMTPGTYRNIRAGAGKTP